MFDAFLPSPRVPSEFVRLPDPALLDEVHAPTAERVARVASLIAEASQSVRDLEDSRPGGSAWQAALAKDAATVGGKEPKAFLAEALLASDGHRWSRASALCRRLSPRTRAVLAEVAADASAGEAVAAALDSASDQALGLLLRAWQAASTEGKGAGWPLYTEAKGALERRYRLRALAVWLTRPEGQYSEASGRTLPPREMGLVLALGCVLEDKGLMTWDHETAIEPHGFAWTMYAGDRTGDLVVKGYAG